MASKQSLKPVFDLNNGQDESSNLKAVIAALNMQKHPEGGYFVVRIMIIRFRFTAY